MGGADGFRVGPGHPTIGAFACWVARDVRSRKWPTILCERDGPRPGDLGAADEAAGVAVEPHESLARRSEAKEARQEAVRKQAEKLQAAKVALPIGWTENYDKKSKRWYFTSEDGAVSWERPTIDVTIDEELQAQQAEEESKKTAKEAQKEAQEKACALKEAREKAVKEALAAFEVQEKARLEAAAQAAAQAAAASAVAAAEAAIGLAIVMLLYRNRGNIDVDKMNHLKG